ncbi:MAG TPA: hypothetical protein VGT44_01085 [Ktedonobacteraceae bacterium]|nr:hypothetical protein [Ktedonobacteraceae bacterium]
MILRNRARHERDCCNEIGQRPGKLPDGKVALAAQREKTPAQVGRDFIKRQRRDLFQGLLGSIRLEVLRGQDTLVFDMLEFVRLRFLIAPLSGQQVQIVNREIEALSQVFQAFCRGFNFISLYLRDEAGTVFFTGNLGKRKM